MDDEKLAVLLEEYGYSADKVNDLATLKELHQRMLRLQAALHAHAMDLVRLLEKRSSARRRKGKYR